jgi:hypothetical protein
MRAAITNASKPCDSAQPQFAKKLLHLNYQPQKNSTSRDIKNYPKKNPPILIEKNIYTTDI